MRSPRWSRTILMLAALAVSLPATAAPQLGSLKKKAEEAAKKKLEEATKKASADSANAKAAADSAKAKSAGDSAKAAPAAGASNAGASSGNEAAPANPKVWDNYDFVPGNKVIFYTDFSEDKVGNFARGLKFVAGQMDVVERDGIKVLRATDRSEFRIPVGKQLPQRFTLEIDVIAPPEPCCGYEVFSVEGGPERDRGAESAEIHWHPNGVVVIGGDKNQTVNMPEAMRPQFMGKLAHVRILMDSGYFKMYVNERRMFNIPEFKFRRDSVILTHVFGSPEDNMAVFITSIRVAESETDVLYDALASKGRWATQGILFATGKAELQPESRPVLKEIAATMKEHGDLKILIEGHTDNVGAAASNLTLSDARAAAVKAALVADFGIAADRMSTKGFGDTKPSVPNATAVGRAQNRRVEIVKQ
ncbi:MAG TPA: OmpA family protein [Gemmatimonadaceae bacterium]|nr:OmpA family protein [Gemmatimonadaceae bacterium]